MHMYASVIGPRSRDSAERAVYRYRAARIGVPSGSRRSRRPLAFHQSHGEAEPSEMPSRDAWHLSATRFRDSSQRTAAVNVGSPGYPVRSPAGRRRSRSKSAAPTAPRKPRRSRSSAARMHVIETTSSFRGVRLHARCRCGRCGRARGRRQARSAVPRLVAIGPATARRRPAQGPAGSARTVAPVTIKIVVLDAGQFARVW